MHWYPALILTRLTERLWIISLFPIPEAAAGGGGRRFPYLHQGHLRAEGQQNLLGLGGVGVVAVLVEPLLERPRHVLQRLPLVPHLAAALPRPAAEKGR